MSNRPEKALCKICKRRRPARHGLCIACMCDLINDLSAIVADLIAAGAIAPGMGALRAPSLPAPAPTTRTAHSPRGAQ